MAHQGLSENLGAFDPQTDPIILDRRNRRLRNARSRRQLILAQLLQLSDDSNMFIDLGNRVTLTDEQFQAEMAARRDKLKLTRNSVVIGCPLCNVIPAAPSATAPRQQQ